MIRSIICNEVAIRQIIDRLRELFHCRLVDIVAPFVCATANYAEEHRIFLTIGGASHEAMMTANRKLALLGKNDFKSESPTAVFLVRTGGL